jgi:hypothetical protein
MTRPPPAAGRAGPAETAGPRNVLAWMRTALLAAAVAALMFRLALVDGNRAELAAATGSGLEAGWCAVAAALCSRRPGRGPQTRRRVRAATVVLVLAAGAAVTAVL